MFGTLRLILASLVVMSHVEIYPTLPGFYWFSQGAAALVGFFLLSGYLMKMIFIQKYSNNITKVGSFWWDRWLRIFPHYYFYLLIICIWIIVSRFAQLNWESTSIISHLTVLPLNFLNFLSLEILDGWAYWALIIPQAWTLASEFQFYLILPFLLRKKWIEIVALLTSFGIFVAAAFGVLPTEAFGYRLLAGTLFIFLSGGLLYDIRNGKKYIISKFTLIGTWILIVCMAIILQHFDKLQIPLNGPVIYGYIILVPLIWMLSGIKNRRSWDDLFGNLSYGIFLNHYWLIWVLDWLKVYPNPTDSEKWIRYGIVMFISSILAFFSYYLIDKNIKNVRLNVRKEKI